MSQPVRYPRASSCYQFFVKRHLSLNKEYKAIENVWYTERDGNKILAE